MEETKHINFRAAKSMFMAWVRPCTLVLSLNVECAVIIATNNLNNQNLEVTIMQLCRVVF